MKKYPQVTPLRNHSDSAHDWTALIDLVEDLIHDYSSAPLPEDESESPFNQLSSRIHHLSQILKSKDIEISAPTFHHERIVLRILSDGQIVYANSPEVQQELESKSLYLADMVDEAQREQLEESLQRTFDAGAKESLLCNMKWPGKSLKPFSLMLSRIPTTSFPKTAICICTQQDPRLIADYKLARTKEELKWLDRINSAVHQNVSLTELAELVVEAYFTFFHGISCRLYKPGESGLEVVTGQVAPVFQDTVEKATGKVYTSLVPTMEEGSVFNKAVAEGEVIVLNDHKEIIESLGAYTNNPEEEQRIDELTNNFFIQSLAIVPLNTKEESLGLLVLCSDRAIRGHLRKSLDRFTKQVLLAIAQYRMQDHLKRSRNTYQDLFNRVPVGLYRSTPEGKLLEANQALVDLLGYPDKESLLDVNVADLYADSEKRIQYLEQLEQKGILKNTELKLLRFDGTEIWVEDYARRQVDAEGSMLYFEGNLIDITDRKIAEEELGRRTKLLAEAEGLAQLGSWEHNLATGQTVWSEQLPEVMGLPVDTTILDDKTLEEALHPDDRGRFRKSYDSLMAHFDAFRQEVRLTKNGNERYAQLACHVERDEWGNPTVIYGTVLDITELKRTETRLAQTNKELLRQNDNLEHFSYVISHNLRAPVANLLGLSSMLDSLELHGTARDVTTRLMNVSETLDETIRDLNEILAVRDARMEATTPVNLNRALQKVQAAIQNQIDETGTTIYANFKEAPEIIALEGYINNILYNLILNAVKYRKSNVPPIIKVATKKKNGQVILSVKDNGLGIDLEAHGDKIFKLYQRFHMETEGKGLGLYLVKTQVEAMGGKIDVESQENKGSTFTVYFPIKKEKGE